MSDNITQMQATCTHNDVAVHTFKKYFRTDAP